MVNYVGYRTVASHADLVLAHSDFASARMKRLYGVRRVVVVPIGNFDGCYPVPRARLDTLRELGLDPDLPVVSCLGAIRRYKGIKTALDAVAALGGRVQLVVAGAMNADVDIRDLWPTAAPPWLRLLPHRLSDQQFADLAEASDAILLPYRRATKIGRAHV